MYTLMQCCRHFSVCQAASAKSWNQVRTSGKTMCAMSASAVLNLVTSSYGMMWKCIYRSEELYLRGTSEYRRCAVTESSRREFGQNFILWLRIIALRFSRILRPPFWCFTAQSRRSPFPPSCCRNRSTLGDCSGFLSGFVPQ